MAGASTCFIFSLAHTSVANTLILMCTGPYVAGLLGWLLLGERVALRTWFTMGIALAGAVVMVSNSYGRGAIVGDVLAIVMASSFAVATVLVRRHPEIQMAPAAALATTLTALVALPFAEPFTTPPRDLFLLAFFGVGQFGAGFLLFMTGARLIPVAESSLIGMLEVVLGPLWVWLVLSERPDAASVIGGALILAALFANTLIDLVAPRRAEVDPDRGVDDDHGRRRRSSARSPSHFTLPRSDSRSRRRPLFNSSISASSTSSRFDRHLNRRRPSRTRRSSSTMFVRPMRRL